MGVVSSAVSIRSGTIALVLLACLASGPAAQTTVTLPDILRLQDDVFEAGTDLARLRTGDTILLKELRILLDQARDEIAGMNAKLREHEEVPASDYERLRERVEEVSRRARSELTATGAGLGPTMAAPLASETPPRHLDMPARTRLKIRLLGRLDPATARVGDRIEASTATNLMVKHRVVVPRGSLVRGIVFDVGSAPHGKRTLTVRFDYLTVDFHAHPIRAVREIDRACPAGAELHIQID